MYISFSTPFSVEAVLNQRSKISSLLDTSATHSGVDVCSLPAARVGRNSPRSSPPHFAAWWPSRCVLLASPSPALTTRSCADAAGKESSNSVGVERGVKDHPFHTCFDCVHQVEAGASIFSHFWKVPEQEPLPKGAWSEFVSPSCSLLVDLKEKKLQDRLPGDRDHCH